LDFSAKNVTDRAPVCGNLPPQAPGRSWKARKRSRLPRWSPSGPNTSWAASGGGVAVSI